MVTGTQRGELATFPNPNSEFYSEKDSFAVL
jgi:hypothetical protein